ncbi:hypothetical protein J6590_085894 [Homalodisca vitripennis]|nr:hypothetical protein J6590_085894 [Homalodisca vitripennis]
MVDEFRSRVACENEVLQLTCNPNTRLAVYSASFGRTEYESFACPQPQGVREESEYNTGPNTHLDIYSATEHDWTQYTSAIYPVSFNLTECKIFACLQLSVSEKRMIRLLNMTGRNTRPPYIR